METAPRLYHVLNQTPGRSSGVDAYFETLRKEQARFLEAIGRARSLLDGDSGELAQFTASQALLTRQFLDAQRSIMKRRAETLAGGIIDFLQPEPTPIAAQRQLAALLDDWWRLENQTGRAVVDAVGVGEAATSCEGVPERIERVNQQIDSTQQLPSDVLAGLEGADPANLLSLLTTLADSLAPRPVEIERRQDPPPVDELVITLDRAPTGITPEETFREFWDERAPHEIDRAAPLRLSLVRRTARSLAAHVLLPMTVVTSAVVLLMAWIG